jgi:hypothetical protein
MVMVSLREDRKLQVFEKSAEENGWNYEERTRILAARVFWSVQVTLDWT